MGYVKPKSLLVMLAFVTFALFITALENYQLLIGVLCGMLVWVIIISLTTNNRYNVMKTQSAIIISNIRHAKRNILIHYPYHRMKTLTIDSQKYIMGYYSDLTKLEDHLLSNMRFIPTHLYDIEDIRSKWFRGGVLNRLDKTKDDFLMYLPDRGYINNILHSLSVMESVGVNRV